MAIKKSAAEECCAKCESDIAALKKEIAALKKALKAKSSGGKDARVEKLVEALKLKLVVGVSKDERLANNEKYEDLINSL
jgi:hypothetical protein